MAQVGDETKEQSRKKITFFMSCPKVEEDAERSKRARNTTDTPDDPFAKHASCDNSDGHNHQNQPADGKHDQDENRDHDGNHDHDDDSHGSGGLVSASASDHLQEDLGTSQEKAGDIASNQCQLRKKAYAENVSQKPLTRFSLTDCFPEGIPLPILSSRDTLRPMLMKAVEIQLFMWRYDAELLQLDLGFPANYAKALEKDHLLLCEVGRAVFCGLHQKGLKSTKKVTYPSVDLNHIDEEWKGMLEKICFKVEEAIVPLIGDKKAKF